MNKMTKLKPYEELEFRDDFMFGKVMQDKELCKEVLECLLQKQVGDLKEIQPERELQYTSNGKPIRLDIYTKDDDEIYDAEMQNLGNKSVESLELPRRTRFYQASIDMDHMYKGQSYKTLVESKILFICTFDPFGKGYSKYTFQAICEEDSEIRLNDGTTRVFYNCSYQKDDIPKDIKKLYNYIENGKCENELTLRIDKAVNLARKNEEWRSAYMKEMAVIMDAKEDGREEERKNTEKERKRADNAEKRAVEAEALVSRYKEKYGELIY